jgi:hypothetical protein
MATQSLEALLPMLKALADESRLALMWRLYREEHTVGDLAERVSLSEPTVSHHLSKLREVGLVSLRMAGNQRYYRVNHVGLDKFKRLIAEIEQLSPEPEDVVVSDNQWIAALGWDEADQEVLREHTVNGKLLRIPAKQKKWLVVLRWLATMFEPDKLYSEPEVNAILKQAYEHDFVSLRRDLIDFGYLRRERGGGKYWLAPAGDELKPLDAD